MMQRGSCIAALVALSACASVPPLSAPSRLAPLDDQCLGQPGYADFRRELNAVVARRDVVAFRGLFVGVDGMRVDGVSLRDSSWSAEGTASVWRELNAILLLGCKQQGERLYLPAVAALVESGEFADETDVVLAPTVARERPDARAPALRRLVRGDIVERINYNAAEGWNEVRIGDRSGFILTSHLRSTLDYQLTLVPVGAGWKIREFIVGV